MKSLPFIATAALTLSVVAAPALVQAQTSATAWYLPSSYYGNLGYGNFDSTSGVKPDMSAVNGRLGARFGRYLGLEGEASVGFGSDTNTAAGDITRTHLNNQYAGYVVGFLPVLPHLDLLARVGYGGQSWNVRDDTNNVARDHQFDSYNYGVGAQYNLSDKDGVRFDYTRFSADNSRDPNSNVYTIDYVRTF